MEEKPVSVKCEDTVGKRIKISLFVFGKQKRNIASDWLIACEIPVDT